MTRPHEQTWSGEDDHLAMQVDRRFTHHVDFGSHFHREAQLARCAPAFARLLIEIRDGIEDDPPSHTDVVNWLGGLKSRIVAELEKGGVRE